MTIDEIKQRIAELEEQKRSRIADVHAIEGALQDCAFWLEKVSKEQEKP